MSKKQSAIVLAAIATCMTPAVKEGRKGPPLTRVFLADGITPLQISDVSTVAAFVSTYKAIAPAEYKGGYATFVTQEDAYTNLKQIRNFTVQGVAKQMALLINRAAEYIIDADSSPEAAADAKAMKQILTALNQYQSVAVAQAQQVREQSVMATAVAALAKAKGCTLEEAASSFAAYVPTQQAPAASANADADTLAETGGNVNDDGDGENADANTESEPAKA